MFTGIVTDVGEILEITGTDERNLRMKCRYDPAFIDLGASIACDGVCLTVTAKGGETGNAWFTAMASAETLSKTTLGSWVVNQRVNLERSMRLGDEMGGHIVAGHVDGRAEILRAEKAGESTVFWFKAPEVLAKYIATKGSVSLNGTSLTVNDVEGDTFCINMIPHSFAETNWADRAPGDMVNLEIDLLARYVERLNLATRA